MVEQPVQRFYWQVHLHTEHAQYVTCEGAQTSKVLTRVALLLFSYSVIQLMVD